MSWIVKTLWLIPALPVLAAGMSALAPRRCRSFAASLAIGSVALSLLLSLCAFAHALHFSNQSGEGRQFFNFPWLAFAGGDAGVLRLGWVFDPLAAVMLVMVSLVSLLIFIYSVGYMAQDENFTRFFCFLSLFAGAMLGVVIANSLLLLFIGWELVGLTSYLLIGFWYHKPAAAAAAKKAFITTRLGDVALLLGMVWLYAQTGTLVFYDHGHGCLESAALGKLVGQTTGMGLAVSTGIGLLIFAGAVGKSGQVPLHVWLPDAMEGPTPVSALIHAATMVAAGVFLVARVYPLMAVTNEPVVAERAGLPNPALVASAGQTATLTLALSEREQENRRPSPGESIRASLSGNVEQTEGQAMTLRLPGGEGLGEGQRPAPLRASPVSVALKVITWIGALTAVFAASIAVAQTDIKRILAYSTVSQLGYMMLGLGVGGVAVGMFHLITHACFKALLFMGAGSVIHGCHEEQDIRRLGGLRRFMPVTFATYAIGMLALAGFPLLFSGFWSKDEILHAARGWSVSQIPFGLGLVGAGLTAFYMTRQVCYVFLGRARLPAGPDVLRDHGEARDGDRADARPAGPHESAAVMTVPLIVLAALAILLGFIGTPAWPWFQSFIGGEPLEFDAAGVLSRPMLSLMLTSAVVVFAGLGVGWWFYGRTPVKSADATDPLEKLRPDLFAVLQNKYWIDELYEATVIRFNAGWSRACDWLDTWAWNGAVQVASYLVLGLSWVNRCVDEYVVNSGFDEGCRRVSLGGKLMSRLQDGRVQHYLRVLGVALAALVLLLIWGCRGT